MFKILFDFLNALLAHFKRGADERVAIEGCGRVMPSPVELLQSTEVGRQGGQFVVSKPQALQLDEFTDLDRQDLQLIFVEHQRFQLLQVADGRGERQELVVAHVEKL